MIGASLSHLLTEQDVGQQFAEEEDFCFVPEDVIYMNDAVLMMPKR